MFQRIWTFVISNKFFRKIWGKLLDITLETGLEAAKTASKMQSIKQLMQHEN